MLQTQFDTTQIISTVPAQQSVREMMTESPVTVTPNTSIAEAQQLMQQHRIRHLPVLEHGHVVGILSDRDLRLARPSPATSLAVYEINYLLSQLTVAEVMTRFVITIAPERTVVEAVRLVLGQKIGALPVVEHGQLVGILTRTDLLRAFLRSQRA
jgi:acetoin utilization protein AcuB